MQRSAFTGAAGIYGVIAILIVVGSPMVIYIGPAVYFIGVAAVSRSAFGTIRSAALRWTALLAACGATIVVGSFSCLSRR
jgi:hypothetical protein